MLIPKYGTNCDMASQVRNLQSQSILRKLNRSTATWNREKVTVAARWLATSQDRRASRHFKLTKTPLIAFALSEI